MHAADYTDFVERNWNRRRAAAAADNPMRDLYIMSTGLGGETGEVLELLKKHVRDGVLDTDDLALELGDVLHYLTRIGLQFGFTLDDIMLRNIRKLEERARKKGYGPLPQKEPRAVFTGDPDSQGDVRAFLRAHPDREAEDGGRLG